MYRCQGTDGSRLLARESYREHNSVHTLLERLTVNLIFYVCEIHPIILSD